MSGFVLRPLFGGSNIPVSSGDIIGRGEQYHVDDKRVSRQHAELEVKDGKLILKPLHTNPCFIRSESGHVTLSRGESKELNHEDVFSLLPDDDLSYQVINEKNENVGLDMMVEEVDEIGKNEEKSGMLNNEGTEQQVPKGNKPDDGVDAKESKVDEKLSKKEGDTEKSGEESEKEESEETEEEEAAEEEEEEAPVAPSSGSGDKDTEGDTVKTNGEGVSVSSRSKAAVTKKRAPRKQKMKKRNQSEDEEGVSDYEEKTRHAPRRKAKATRAADSDNDTEEEPISRRRPSRRASQNKMYSDELIVSEDEEIIASDDERFTKKKDDQEDSDFIAEVEEVVDSGSDWENSQTRSAAPKKGRPKGRPKKAPVGRSRGRPRKMPVSEEDDEEDEVESPPKPPPVKHAKASPAKRGRGRPPRKAQKPVSDEEESEEEYVTPSKRRTTNSVAAGKKLSAKELLQDRPQRNVANVQVTNVIDSGDEEFAEEADVPAENEERDSDWSPEAVEEPPKKRGRGRPRIVRT